MKKSEKIFFVQNLTEKLKEAKGITLVDYQGLTVAQINKLREKIKQAGATLEVVKNRLLKRALHEAGLKIETEIIGPTALVLSTRNEIAPLKVVLESIRAFALPKFKFGFLEQKRLEGEELEKLASLPGRDQLLAQVTATLAYPGRKLIYSLNYNKQKLVAILDELSKKKGGDE